MKALTKIFALAFALSVGVCSSFGGTVTTFAEDCNHTFSTSWESDDVNHWHPSTCGHDIVTDVEPHNYVNGVCTECGKLQPEEEHVHSFSASWTSDEVNHWHASTCNHDIVADMAAHTYKNGVCTECGAVQPTADHVHSFSAAWEYDEMYHYHLADCHNVVADMSLHTIGANGVCTVCGYRKITEGGFTDYGAYSESMYAEWTAESKQGVTVSYRPSGATNWVDVDDELIRVSDGTARVDVVGIKAGTYSIRVADDTKTIQQDNIQVEAYDRSGYAHFNYTSGVGAYTDEGVPKDGAQIIYVTEATKNTVEAKIGSTTYKGIVNILTASPKATNPIIVRIIGTVGAAAWKPINYKNIEGVYNSSTKKYNATPEIIIANTPGKNGNVLEARKYFMTELIEKGFNELDTSVYAELDGLSALSYMNYSDGEFDSCWNNCSIGGSSSHPQNITIEGIGTDAQIVQWGFTFRYATSIEVRNLTFDDYTEDACSFEGGTDSKTMDGFDSNRIWLHNCTFYEGHNTWDVCSEQDKGEGDGSTDFKKCAYITLSYNHYIETHKTGLIGGGDTHMTACVTFHHNFYDQCQSRLPLARQANMHMYNNYYYKTSNTCVDVRANGYAFVEYCYYEDAKNPALGTSSSNRGYVKLYNCEFAGTTQLAQNEYVKLVSNRTDTVTNTNAFSQNFDTDPAVFYYDAANKCSKVTSLTTNLSELPALIRAVAGANH